MAEEFKSNYQLVADRILNDIRAKRYKEDDPLPSISDMATKCEKSRSTIQRAYSSLVEQGVVYSIPGKGFVVAAQPVNYQRAEVDSDSAIKIFLSYAHADDKNTHGGITQLKNSLIAEYKLQTGYDLQIFQDKDDIRWGDDWRDIINRSLGTALIFMPILTPTYLRRPNCLAELKNRVQQMKGAGYDAGIYPIEFVDCKRALAALQDDELANILAETQYCDWTTCRLENPSSSAYTKGISEIVGALIKIDDNLEKPQNERLKSFQQTADESSEDVDSSLIEDIAAMNDSLVALTNDTYFISNDITTVGKVFEENAVPQGANIKQALAAVMKIGEDLGVPSSELEKHCHNYSEHMRVVDKGVNSFIEFGMLFKGEDSNNGYKAQLQKFKEQVDDLRVKAEGPLDQVDNVRRLLRSAAKLARPLREPCRKIDAALDEIVSSKSIMDGWAEEISHALN